MTGFWSTVQVVGSLALVLLLILLAAKFAAKRGLMTSTYPEQLRVRARVGLSRGAQVVIVRHADKDLVLGVTEQQVALLKEIDAAEELNLTDDTTVPAEVTGQITGQTKTFIEALRERTIRR